MVELLDLRSLERLDVTTEGIRQVAAHDADHMRSGLTHRLALVASEDAAFGMARMYQIQAEDHLLGLGVFRNPDDALIWLGVSSMSVRRRPR